ncbi:hypothetical protein [Zymobacter palmae]|uniref:Phage-related minor tail protein n=1 Tax=Zymobacter palmae TaxID=33074 RepID=A0A348HEE3_9GAMM|nr:hypothetical protein [Zymobacter palmae]BBG29995.1 phage-related minor tail protein [Zymobacter palmae]
MNVARSYEAYHDLQRGRFELNERALARQGEAIDREIDRTQHIADFERISDVESCQKRIASALDDNSDPSLLFPLLAELRISQLEIDVGRPQQGMARRARVLKLLDQHIYDAICEDAQRELGIL